MQDDPVTMYLNDVFTVTANLAGIPGLAVPAGLDSKGLPLGLQVLGKAFDEETVFAVGRALEQGRQLHRHSAGDGRGMSYTLEGATGTWEVVIGLEVHAQVTSQSKLFSGRGDRVRRRAEQPGQLRRCRLSRHAAGDQRRVRGAGRAHWPRTERAGEPVVALRPQELLLCRPAAGLPDQPVRVPYHRDWRDRDHARRRQHEEHRHHAPAPGAGCRQVAARPAPDQELSST
jgi:hypothetical protein